MNTASRRISRRPRPSTRRPVAAASILTMAAPAWAIVAAVGGLAVWGQILASFVA